MLEKKILVDRLEVAENGNVQVRAATRVIEDGVVISQSFQRRVISPGQDYSTEDPKVQAICAAAHTPEVIEAYQAAQAAQGV